MPLQLPVLAVSVDPGCGVPVIAGAPLLVGAAAIAAVPLRAVLKTEAARIAAAAITEAPVQRGTRLIQVM